MDLGISGKQAIVCASTRGLGFGCASALQREGVDVVICGRDPVSLDRACETLTSYSAGGNVTGVCADVASAEGREKILSACPTPDILINNAGGPPPGDFRSWGREEWLQALDANMLTAIELIKAVIDPMIGNGFGRIVNITSHAVKEPTGLLGLSNGARAGLTGFVAGLARDVAPNGVTINNLLPGQFDTDRLRSNHEKFAAKMGLEVDELRERARRAIPVQRFGSPEEFGAACAFLCSAHAGFMTGQNVMLDGGQYKGIL